MDVMRWIVATVIACASNVALAQEVPVQQPSQPALAPPAPFYRFTMRDGRVIDAYWTGGDANNYFIQTPAGTFWLSRADVVAAAPFTAAPVAPVPTYPAPTYPAPAPARDPYFRNEASDHPEPKDTRSADKREGLLIFGGFYAITALIAMGRLADDKDAAAGLLPIVGPVAWTMADDDKWLSDGYDWLALTSASCQLIGIFRWIDGVTKDAPKKKTAVSVVPVSRGDYGGFVVTGSF
jgi:hypothetical protein